MHWGTGSRVCSKYSRTAIFTSDHRLIPGAWSKGRFVSEQVSRCEALTRGQLNGIPPPYHLWCLRSSCYLMSNCGCAISHYRLQGLVRNCERNRQVVSQKVDEKPASATTFLLLGTKLKTKQKKNKRNNYLLFSTVKIRRDLNRFILLEMMDCKNALAAELALCFQPPANTLGFKWTPGWKKDQWGIRALCDITEGWLTELWVRAKPGRIDLMESRYKLLFENTGKANAA